MTKTIGVILAGAGFKDGAEIHEAVVALLALDRAGVAVRIFAPDMQLAEVNPLTVKQIAAMGHAHVDCAVDNVVIDADRKVVTAPAYMYDARISEVAAGIDKMVAQVVAWA